MNIVHVIKNNSLLQSVLSGLLLTLSFINYFFFLIFFAFVPLLYTSKSFFDKKLSGLKFILLCFLSFLIWNILTTWWISLASIGGAIMAIVANSILMSAVFTTPFFLQLKNKKSFHPWWLLPFWISFEYLHFHWDLMWPWLTLGNVFAFQPYIIQWYELTGTSGGTLWILSVNILLFQVFLSNETHLYLLKKTLTLLIVPILLSFSIYLFRSKEEYKNQAALNVLIVQPNIDPYNEKFYIEPLTQVQDVYHQIKNYLHDSIHLILLPETFITENIYEGTSQIMLQHESLKFLKDSILNKYPDITIITGANTFKFYTSSEEIPSTARLNSEGMYYDIFNTALCIYKDSVQIFHKSKLVPGVEKMPYPALFKPLEKLAIDLGGTTGSLGRQKHPSLLYVQNKIGVATVICYESVFSDFVSRFFKLGAKSLLVITNDGWWGNTPGYFQHFIFGRLRAIENRTYIARSANTGISAVINPLGEIEHQTTFWKKDVLSVKIYLNNKKTIYSTIGDIISPINALFLLFLIIQSIFYGFHRPS
ncbi:MAG: apolipoprotein N-acyltransferase [Bacteroidia bacterium]|nr:apolipoprotein N-acyltransferase [Bacteroidia bacterium]